jgi:hypothetical protein
LDKEIADEKSRGCKLLENLLDIKNLIDQQCPDQSEEHKDQDLLDVII